MAAATTYTAVPKHPPASTCQLFATRCWLFELIALN
ncbi:hypothetical protein XHC_3950 [Xanthomonas hortorum pv. carotae str. M081]|nr:hypothetical protein XHC_3950 [Xanthomonas hortorum pv. carotae str. M081]